MYLTRKITRYYKSKRFTNSKQTQNFFEKKTDTEDEDELLVQQDTNGKMTGNYRKKK